MSVCYEPGSTNWTPGRGDYGTEYAGDLIEIIERLNCALGCTKADGGCEILARVFLTPEEGIPELDPRREGPHCRAREDPATAGMEPLFEVNDL